MPMSGGQGSNWTGLPMFAASQPNLAGGDYDLSRVNVTLNPQMAALHSVYGTQFMGTVGATTTTPGFVASAATLNAPGDALLGSAVRYPSMPVPMPYAQIQVQPVAQLMEPAFDQIRMAQASLLTKPVSQLESRAIPAANPALYAAAMEGGYKPNAYLTDYHDPYGGLDAAHGHTSHGGNIWEGGSLAKFGLGRRDGNLTHTMHPHIRLMAALENQHLALSTHGGVGLG